MCTSQICPQSQLKSLLLYSVRSQHVSAPTGHLHHHHLYNLKVPSMPQWIRCSTIVYSYGLSYYLFRIYIMVIEF
jgi:hypothetical protein